MRSVRKPTIPPGVLLPCLVLVLGGCVSPKYKLARDETRPPVMINLATTQPPIVMVLNTVIIYRGPGSWKREAFWDEYVVSVHNHGEQPLTITSAALTDSVSATYPPGDDPWVLEQESKSLEQKYLDAGLAFARNAAPGAIVFGTAASAGLTAGIYTSTAAAWAAGGVILLPTYYITVAFINHHNKTAVMTEFKRRRMVLPLNVAPGETRTGSLFFPMVPNPRSLSLHWSNGENANEAVRSLEALQGLHIQPPTASDAAQAR